MGILASTRSQAGAVPGRWIMVPSSASAPAPRSRRNRLIRRRRQNFMRLLVVAGITGSFALVPGLHFFVLAHLAADAGLAAYVVHLRRLRSAEVARRAPVVVASAQDTERVIALDRHVALDRRVALDRHIGLERRAEAVSG